METEQEAQEGIQNEEESYRENLQPEQDNTQEAEHDTYMTTEQKTEQLQNKNLSNQVGDRSNFFHGLAVGLGVGCIATFVIVWVTVFFTPRLPGTVTYENLLSIFIYPLIYLLSVGLVALTAGIVREYYTTKSKI